jgi:hypothetical protein
MALMGKAALAMWWDIAPEDRPGFEHWHSSEHFAERLAVPGFLRGSGWVAVSGAPYYFVMYELTGLDVMGSEAYRERVNHPTPWTTQTMARFRNMVRSQCLVTASAGDGMAHAMLTLRFSPQAGQAQRLREWVVQQILPALIAKPGLNAAHLIENAVPAVPLSGQTAEQKLRGGDATADWVLLVNGYDISAVSALAEHELNEQNFERNGAQSGRVAGVYRLGFAQDKPGG